MEVFISIKNKLYILIFIFSYILIFFNCSHYSKINRDPTIVDNAGVTVEGYGGAMLIYPSIFGSIYIARVGISRSIEINAQFSPFLNGEVVGNDYFRSYGIQCKIKSDYFKYTFLITYLYEHQLQQSEQRCRHRRIQN